MWKLEILDCYCSADSDDYESVPSNGKIQSALSLALLCVMWFLIQHLCVCVLV